MARKKLMILNYKNKVIKALALADNLDQVDFIEKKIESTDKINRHTNAGRELTRELLNLCNARARELIKAGEQPF